MTRRILIAVIAVLSLALMASTASAAKHHAKARHHVAKHHGRKHKAARRHARVVVRRAAETGTEEGEASNTVESFGEGVLKIKLAGGEVVSGKVGAHTHLVCVTPPPAEEAENPEEQSENDGEQPEEGGEQGWGGEGFARVHAAHAGNGNGNGDEDQDDQEGGEVKPCESSEVTAGKKVLFAQLAIGAGGAEWAVVVLSA